MTRSQSPDGTRQEIWTLLCLCQALADLVSGAPRDHRIDPDRISFLRTGNTPVVQCPGSRRIFPSAAATRP